MRPQRIVVADDDSIVVRFLSTILRSEGFTVETAGDGETALSLIRRSPPDLAILDRVMPFLDGLEVCRRVRLVAETRRIPVIILSMEGQDAIRASEMGADDQIRKPFDALDLLARARTLLPGV